MTRHVYSHSSVNWPRSNQRSHSCRETRDNTQAFTITSHAQQRRKKHRKPVCPLNLCHVGPKTRSAMFGTSLWCLLINEYLTKKRIKRRQLSSKSDPLPDRVPREVDPFSQESFPRDPDTSIASAHRILRVVSIHRSSSNLCPRETDPSLWREVQWTASYRSLVGIDPS